MAHALQPYPEYKDSGVPWLGKIPAQWETHPLKRLASVRLSGVDKHSIEGETPVRLCNYTDVYYQHFITSDLEFMRATATEAEIAGFTLRQGDVLITKDSETPDDIAVPALVTQDLEGVLCGYHLALVRPKQELLNGRYLMFSFLAPALSWQFEVSANGITRYGISKHAIKNGTFLLPPLEEQHAIARFLDHYDRLTRRYIRAQRRLIALLEEQKQAFIQRAVTRGLDPDVPLKDSGIEWLGEIPAHWEVRRVKQVAHLITSNVDKHTNPEEKPVRLCNYTDVYYNEYITSGLDFMKASATQDEIERFRLCSGDVIITKDSEMWNDIGVPALVCYEAPDLLCGYHLAILRPDSTDIAGEFLMRCLQNRVLATQLHVAANGITRYGLSQQAIKDMLIPVPPPHEQDAITKIIAQSVSALTTTTGRIQRQIDLVREYRTRLIADVVTGKLDVRGVSLPDPDAGEEPADFDELEEDSGSEEETDD